VNDKRVIKLLGKRGESLIKTRNYFFKNSFDNSADMHSAYKNDLINALGAEVDRLKKDIE
tara:strand:+ start:2545 stop:2724 length:180 start_codon:yes stop_codon:yes gene_type:complete